MARPNNFNAREILSRTVRDPSQAGIPFTPIQCFEAIGGPRFLEFVPEQSRAATSTQEKTDG